MKIIVEVEVPDEVFTSSDFTGLAEHVTKRANLAVKEFMENEVDPKGCWCTGLDHQRDCHNWVLPY